MNKDDLLKEVKQYGDALHIDIWYPRTDNPIKAIQVGLMDVRAADDIRIEYDFERDGWVIKQAQVIEWSADDEVCDPQWKEVAFVKAWESSIETESKTFETLADYVKEQEQKQKN